VFELNASHHDVSRALANARAIGLLEQPRRPVKVVTSANALAADGHKTTTAGTKGSSSTIRAEWLQPRRTSPQMIATTAGRRSQFDQLEPRLTVTAKTDGALCFGSREPERRPAPSANHQPRRLHARLEHDRGDLTQRKSRRYQPTGNVNFTSSARNRAVEAERKDILLLLAANSFTLLSFSDSGVMMTRAGS